MLTNAGIQWKLPIGDTLLTTGDVARLLKVRPECVKRWCDTELLAHFKTPGGQRRIRASAVQEAIDARRIPPPRGRRGQRRA